LPTNSPELVLFIALTLEVIWLGGHMVFVAVLVTIVEMTVDVVDVSYARSIVYSVLL
jgi:hypothetical protein